MIEEAFLRLKEPIAYLVDDGFSSPRLFPNQRERDDAALNESDRESGRDARQQLARDTRQQRDRDTELADEQEADRVRGESESEIG